MKFTIMAELIIITIIDLSQSQRLLSKIGKASQSTTFWWYGIKRLMTANLAIEGGETNNYNSGSCASTAGGQYSAWWMLSFFDTVYITNVIIFHRQQTVKLRFSFYSLYVSNTTVPSGGKPTGHLCYQHQGDTSPSLKENLTCNAIGRNVIIYNYRNKSQIYPDGIDSFARLELCDVQVYGCPSGKYGIGCEQFCPVNCGGPCDLVTGRCVYGCKDGWIGSTCDEACKSPYFGNECKYECHCKDYQSCNYTDGMCPSKGCQKGWKGSNCAIACMSGRFGDNCSESCYFCRNQHCSHIDGVCFEGGCQRGYQGVQCKTECTKGHFGFNCNESCPGCVLDECDSLNGSCLNTTHCKPGWFGQNCNQSSLLEEETSYFFIIEGISSTTVVCVAVLVICCCRCNRSNSQRNEHTREMRNVLSNQNTKIANSKLDEHAENVYYVPEIEITEKATRTEEGKTSDYTYSECDDDLYDKKLDEQDEQTENVYYEPELETTEKATTKTEKGKLSIYIYSEVDDEIYCNELDGEIYENVDDV